MCTYILLSIFTHVYLPLPVVLETHPVCSHPSSTTSVTTELGEFGTMVTALKIVFCTFSYLLAVFQRMGRK